MGEAILWLEPIGPVTLQSSATGTGNGTAMTLAWRYGVATVFVHSDDINATITFEGSLDGSHYYAVRGHNLATGALVTTATAAGLYVFDVAGLYDFRARISGYTAGTITATAWGIPALAGFADTVTVSGAIPAGSNAIGKLAANSGVDIGDVDVTSLPADTFAADAQAYGKGVLIQGDDGTDRRAILVGTDGHMQVDVLSSASHAVTNAGTFAVQAALASSISEWPVTGTSAANTEQTITKASGGGTTKHVITGFEVVIRGATAGADISVALKDGSTVVWQTYIGSGAVRGERVGIVFAHGIEMTAATAANLYVGAGGASVISEANMAGYTKAA